MMPEYIRLAMRDCIKRKDTTAIPHHLLLPGGAVADMAPHAPMVVFINPKSGGRHGPVLKERLQQLMSEEQVAGGDGTVGWVLGCLGELNKEGKLPIPPVGVIPLGTGNDLSRSFGWGGSFPFAWRIAVKRTLHRASMGPVARLDSWKILVSMPSGEVVNSPYSLKPADENELDEVRLDSSPHHGSFLWFSGLGMDAQVAYGFHNLRNTKPYLAQGPISNKLIYSGFSCTQGWFCTPCVSDPGLRGLRNILKIHIKKVNFSEWEEIAVPKNVRSVVALNLESYGSGSHPWGNLRPDYLEKRGFVEAHCDDGLIEIFAFKHGWHASFVMTELISAKHIAQAAAVRFELRGGDWKDAFLQMDGEPWKQPMSTDYSTFVEIKKAPFQSLMINGV
ncbi:unnamed protein product [Eruca vesicaria subsp. sativa]|uniref:Diacylglycerol kinase n=1 Tax=Eruca vesicaria subsp. sativa TaxID=29727 RepID=A0ABC8JC50_ERUVS|nr:unnamed protein product [Eruca vesicaria subsp. sativa]